jgi:phosphoribosylformylglycinamidine synthase
VKARVLVRPKPGILEPQGKAVERALPALGFEGVSNVRVGRLVELEIEDPAQLAAMCEQLLTNPLIEDYEVVTQPRAEEDATSRDEGAQPVTEAPASP